MNNEDIVAAFRLFEADQPVEDYEAFGFQVWPVLRNWLGFQLVFDQKGGVERKDSNGTFLWRRFLSVCSMIGDSVRYRIPVPPRREGGENAGETVCRMNAIILTDSNRCFMRGGCLFHYIADPAVQELGRLGVAAVVWDMGQVRSGKRVVEPVWVRRRLDVEIRRGLSRSRISGEFAQWERVAPMWFETFGRWASGLLGRSVAWSEVVARLRYVCLVGRIFEEWFGKNPPHFLVVDCWYGLTTMGAILAASRLGIRTLDIQHGLQGACDFGYTAWTRGGVSRYAVLPDAFWVWGRENVANLCTHNAPAFVEENRVGVGGNLWLNRCRYHADADLYCEIDELKRLTSRYDRVYLVTLQPAQGVEETVWPAVRNSPPEVFWFVRLHPRMSAEEKHRIEQWALEMGERVNVKDAARVSLYALFQVIAVHLTGYSTCALEALAFGKPTVLVHPSGLVLFRRQIEQGIMVFEPEPQKVWESIRVAETIPREVCQEGGNGFFASEFESREGLRRLFVGLENRC